MNQLFVGIILALSLGGYFLYQQNESLKKRVIDNVLAIQQKI